MPQYNEKFKGLNGSIVALKEPSSQNEDFPGASPLPDGSGHVPDAHADGYVATIAAKHS